MRVTHRRTTTKALVAMLGAAGLITATACADTTDNADGQDESATPTDGAGLTPGPTETEDDTTGGSALVATVSDADGNEFGTADFTDMDDAVEVNVEFAGLDPGFYGLHIHGTGLCEPDSAAPDDPEDTGDFLSAGSHLGSEESDHPGHAGDLPQLLVKESGEAVLTFQTDRFTLDDLSDEDGSALMIHSDPDNYGNVPERYAPEGPDEDTLSTGDAGSRLACGVIG